MSTGFRGGYIRGISSVLREDDGVDAGGVSDQLVNNVGHLYDAHHGHIVNIVSETGLPETLFHNDPSSVLWYLLGRWPFNMVRAPDGGSANVVYRLKFYRDGGAGTVYVGARIGRHRVEGFSDYTAAPFRSYQASHSTTATTPTAASGTLYTTAANIDERHPLIELSGAAAGAFPARSARVRLAWFELWCLYSGTKSTIRVSSLMARQFVRL